MAHAVGESAVLEATGRFTYNPSSPAMTVDSCFDCASLSKVVATTTAVMLLEEAGTLPSLEAPVAQYYPEFAASGKQDVTLRQLLIHTSGLPAFREYEKQGITNRQGVIDAIMAVR